MAFMIRGAKLKKLGGPIFKVYSCRKYKDSKSLRKKAWKLMSQWVRNRGSKDDANKCFTCGQWLPIKSLDAGHYIHRDSLDFHPINIQPQCTKCNRHLHGNSGVFAHNLIITYGLQAYKELEALRFREDYFGIRRLEEIIEDLKSKICTSTHLKPVN